MDKFLLKLPGKSSSNFEVQQQKKQVIPISDLYESEISENEPPKKKKYAVHPNKVVNEFNWLDAAKAFSFCKMRLQSIQFFDNYEQYEICRNGQ
ncbi:hypothetical protein RN001_005616 [Aquatica leii]|uniref:Uncharacterized protein n=1 Tax=Aquatica leii TaxID=1421715 RepID=A0AAN7PC47_9COLE|nr:hypothetical protein RN001_005616 [Aquatica leii]